MIFVGGVHGVGKSSFCNLVKHELAVDSFTASDLIAQRKQISFPLDKRTSAPEANQRYLVDAVQELDSINPRYLLDGHFCLLNTEEQIVRIPSETFISLNPAAIILLTEDPVVISERRKRRDGIDHDIAVIRRFQDEEHSYAKLIADMLEIPIRVSLGFDDLANAVEFVRQTIERDSNGR